MKSFILLFCLVMAGLFLSAQTFFEKTYPKGYATSVIQTYDGGYALTGTGRYHSVWPYGRDFLLKTDANGDSVALYDFQPDEPLGITFYHSLQVFQLQDSTFLLGGYKSFNGGYYSSHLLWISETGGVIREKDYGGGDAVFIHSAIQSRNGNTWFLISEEETEQDSGRIRSAVRIIGEDPNGTTIVSKQYLANPYFGVAGFDLVETKDENLVFAGLKKSSNRNKTPYLFFVDQTGSVLHDHTYDLGVETLGFTRTNVSLKETFGGGGFVIAGNIRDTGSVYRKSPFLIKTGKKGGVFWQKVYHDTLDINVGEVIQASDGGFLIAGWIRRNDEEYPYLLKTNIQGGKQWHRIFDQDSVEGRFNSVLRVDDGYVVCGELDDHIMLKKLDKFGRVVSIEREGVMASVSFGPNPVTPESRFFLPSDWEGKPSHLKVFNALGMLIYEQTETIQNQRMDLKANGLPGGIYFYQLSTHSGKLVTGKFLVE